jgi:hypothetical protein
MKSSTTVGDPIEFLGVTNRESSSVLGIIVASSPKTGTHERATAPNAEVNFACRRTGAKCILGMIAIQISFYVVVIDREARGGGWTGVENKGR